MAAAAVCALGGGVVGGAGVAAAAPPGLRLPPLPEPLATWVKPPVPAEKRLASSFAGFSTSMRKTNPGQIGIALVPVGSDATISLGPLKTGRAWSTLKVPVSLAAERKLGYRIADKEKKAIAFSDNDAAGELWGDLGGGRSSVAAVTDVLHEGHDTRTHVSSEADVPRSYPGHTRWALADQALFGAHLPCMPGSEHIIRLMSAVAPNQQWGAATLGRKRNVVTAVKGGWGPVSDASPGYLVRQLAILSTTQGQVAVSMAAIPKSGRFADGTRMLDKMGDWLGRNMTTIPAGRCPLR
ncbi:hypothetical protein GCM10009624_20490 [Gordonia sinesedis]